ncbi:hypothetical protein AB3S75_047539 [Citrus x aurantiifolia]
MFMGYSCVACELLYLIIFLITETQSESLVDVVVSAVRQGSPLSFLVALSLFGWAIKQTINVIQVTSTPYDDEDSSRCVCEEFINIFHFRRIVCGSPAQVPTFQGAAYMFETGI